MTGPLAEATSLEPLGEGEFAATLDERFSIAGSPNGGYLLALLAAAATSALEATGVRGAACLAASAAYARAPRIGEVRVSVTVDRRGAQLNQVHAELRQADRTLVRALLTTGRRRARGPSVPGPPPCPLTERSRCERAGAGGPPGRGISVLDRVEVRLDPTTPLHPESPPAVAETRAWVRLDEERDPDELALLLLLDVLPPATIPLGSTGWVPTIQLSAAIRGLPSSVWLRGRQRARWVHGGLVQQCCELWDESGTLCAEATQLAMVRFG